MAQSLRRILDGEPCEASNPPELAEVAARLKPAAVGAKLSEKQRRSLAVWIGRYITQDATSWTDVVTHVESLLASTRAAAMESAAKICEQRKYDRFYEHGTTEPDTNAGYYTGSQAEFYETMDEEDDDCAAAIRNAIGTDAC